MSTFKQNDSALPVPGTNQKKSEYLLPKFFRTDTNKKFLGSTVDQLISSGSVEKVNAYAGRRTAKSKDNTKIENYLEDSIPDRENYQFEPALIEVDDLDNVTFYKDYIDYLGQLNNFKSKTKNHSKMNSQEFYVWDPHIDFDKFTNFREYYWLPNGPLAISVFGKSREIESTYTVKTVRDDDNFAYVFSPDGFTRNPTLTLYRGETYYFEVDAKGYGLAFATNRTFLDLDPIKVNDRGQNISALYTKGVTSPSDYVEKGTITFKVPDDAPDTLYYVSETDINVSGIILIKNIEENTFIDVANEIIGKKTYKSTQGVVFSNGMKVQFFGEVVPEKYNNGNWYVEGVGDAIRLISEIDLDIPAPFTEIKNTPFDGVEFDTFPLENSAGFPSEKDYIVINRASADGNPWSRYNRWFHQDVIVQSAKFNNQTASLDQDSRAKRPIIEFEAGLKLFNHGTRVKGTVDLVDNYTKDVFSTVEGSFGYYVDNVPLSDGMRVLFTADTDVRVSGRIFQVKFLVHNTKTIITLIPTEDSEPANNEVVVVRMGERFAGSTFYYSGSSWRQSQRKTKINQHPLFELYDSAGNSFVNRSVYPASTFSGNRIFGYKIGEGIVDSELGFPLTYQNIANIGDIVFEYDLLKNSFQYQKDNTNVEVKTDIGFIRKYNYLGTAFEYVSGWVKSDEPSKQYVIRQYVSTGNDEKYKIDVYDNAALLTDLELKVYVNNEYKNASNYKLVKEFSDLYVKFNNSLEQNDNIVIRAHSSANKNENGYYEIPSNFEKNPLNENVTDFTLGEVNDHVRSIIENTDNFTGVFPGSGNLRDLGNYRVRGRKFLQHSGPVNLALFNITDQSANAVKAIRKSKNDYASFKKQFLKAAFDSPFTGTAREHVDYIFSILNSDKTENMPYFASDMVPYSGNNLITYNVIDAGSIYYAIPKPFSLSVLCTRSVLVYINDQQLIHGIDYEFDQDGFVKILTDLDIGDVINISYYENTNGSFVPPTPSKLGLYPKFVPEIYIDDTYSSPKKLIRGHDGSVVLAYEDYRDDIILELEKRIYNNIKVNYDANILDIHEFVGGYFRNTGFSSSEIDEILLTDFSQWLSGLGPVDYGTNPVWDVSNSFTYNYKNSQTVTDTTVSGSWKKIYVDLYDTTRPHTHPWEMLGFYNKPNWWENVYGPAPYTSTNAILWNDIEQGVIREPNKPVVKNSKYSRIGIKNYLPVDENGNLLSPLESNYITQINVYETNSRFVFGDWSPTETAWRKSSEYPFALITAWMILQPPKIFGLGFDRSAIIRDFSGALVYAHTKKRIQLESLVFPQKTDAVCNITGSVLSKTLTAGIVNYVAEYLSDETARYDEYTNRYKKLTNNLAFRLGGFAEKSKLKLVLDSRSPLNKGNVFVPEENYTIFLNKSSALQTVTYSGVIIEKLSQGFRISGYDIDSPFFEYNAPFSTQTDPSTVVGGVSETFVEWGENKTYALGTVVRYNGSYYRSKISHVSSSVFDTTKFALLPELPLIGGRRILIRKIFNQDVSVLMYGTILTEIQQVVDFLLGYQNRLKELGFKFDFVNPETQALEDWLLATKEFVFWTTQNWGVGSVITLSPSANKLIFERPYYVVDNIYDSFYNYKILKSDGTQLNQDLINTVRSNSNEFSLVTKTVTEDGIYFAKLPLVQKEHVVFVDNRTVFNDVIYDTSPGYRQERILVVGYRTDDWNGSLNIPGFVYDQALIKQWTPWTDYKVADLVKYKEFYYSCNTHHVGVETFDDTLWNLLPEKPVTSLLPNWDYKAEQITQFYSLETENFDSEQQRLAQHLVGYQKRQYLENIINDEVSQYKFYHGFIQDKGTRNALEKLFNALGNSEKDSLEFYEEWAIRVGQYGAVDTFKEVEFKLDERKYRLDPQTVELVQVEDSSRTDLIYQLPKNEVYLAPVDYNNKPFPSKYLEKTYTKNSGYVNPDNVDITMNTYQDILNLDINQIKVNDYIWVLEKSQSWDVLRVVNAPYKILEISLVNGQYAIKFDDLLKVNVNDIVGFIGNSTVLNGFYTVERVELDKLYITTKKDLTTVKLDQLTASLIVLEPRRFETFEHVNNTVKNNLYYTDLGKVWVDYGENNQWSVFENVTNEVIGKTDITPVSGFSQMGYGSSVAVTDDNTILVVGAPGTDSNSKNAVFVYYRINGTQNINSKNNLIQVLTPITGIGTNPGYGTSIEIAADGKYLFVGAPYASNVKTRYRGEINITSATAYNLGDIVSDNGKLWRAKNTISYSNAVDFREDWESVSYIEYDKDGYTVSNLNNQGLIFIYEKDITSNNYILKTIVTTPKPVSDEKFGYTLKSSIENGVYTLFVGAPGTGNVVVLDTSSGSFGYKINQNYTGEYKETYYYSTGDIVKNGSNFFEAITNIEFESVFDNEKWEILPQSVSYVASLPGYVSDLDLQNSSNVGTVLDASDDGFVLAITGFNNLENGPNNVISVYRLVNGNYTYFQTLTSEDNYESYGASVSVSEDGRRIAVGAPNNDDTGIDNGKVYVYKFINDQFVLDQSLVSPANDFNEMYGQYVRFNGTELLIGSKNGDIRSPTTYDEKTTTFDKKSTVFSSISINTGNVYVYELIGDYFVYADARYTTDIGMYELKNFTASKNQLYVALPQFGNNGKVINIRVEPNVNSWKALSSPVETVNLDLLKRVYLYNTTTNSLLLELDYIDPRQGKIPGPAEQELAFKTYYDPAIYNYSNGTTNTVIDEDSAWTFQNVGKLWWNIETAKWYNPYQGDSQYRVTYWNQLLPDASIDVYEWVESTLPPSQWDRVADTNEGFAVGISGKSLYGDAVYSQKKIYNNSNTEYTTLYYFWVRNKRIIPNNNFRKLTADAVAALISDPSSFGYRFIAFTGNDRFALFNSKSLIDENNVALHVSYYENNVSNSNIHNEYQILTEDLSTSKPSLEIEKKWIDSLIGYDLNRKPIPDPALPIKNRYGVLNMPRQGMFKNRTLALQQVIERVNLVLADNNISDGYDLTQLYSKDPIPNMMNGLYDTVIENYSELRFVNVARVEQAVLTPTIENGKIVDIEITNPGRGYKSAPNVFANDTYGRGAVFATTIDELGKISSIEIIKSGENYTDDATLNVRAYSVLVTSDETSDNKWSIFEWNVLTQEWNRTFIQSYDTTRYWFFTDWYSQGFTSASRFDYVVEYPYLLSSINDSVGDIIRVNNLGSGGWAILKKIDNQITSDYTVNYQTVARQNGTIQFSTTLYDYAANLSGFDANIYGTTRYDTEPVIELRKIFESLKNDIFVGDLEIEWNRLFFSSLRYILSEQDSVDWLFKTSFVKIKHNFGSLDQKVTFKNNNLESYQDYVNEVKPYSTKIREFVSAYEKLEPTGTATYDFDNPSFYNIDTMKIENTSEIVVNGVVEGVSDNTNDIWLSNLGYKVTEVIVTNPGKDFTVPPKVTIDGGRVPARAYLQRGKIYHIEVLPHSKRYLTAPNVVIEVLDEDNESQPKAIAVLGNGLVKTFNVSINFDRVSRSPMYQTTEVTEIFTGNGSKNEFVLRWPIDLNTKKTEIFVNNVEILQDEFNVKNILDNKKSYARHLGVVEFSTAPANGSRIEIRYNRNIEMFDAVDRITHYYDPQPGMAGDLARLMSGIEYSGVNVTSYGFGNEQGFSAGGFGTVPWDTYDLLSDDRQYTLNTRKRRLTLEKPFDRNEVYNVYLNNVRVDDPNYGTSTPVTNPNAKVKSIVGNGTSTTYTIPNTLVYVDGDILIFRKSTSDGSFAPRDFSYDSIVQGGTFLPGSAAGLAASDITVDGEGFVTKTTSEGPEELVPGQITDTLDISVFHSPTDGSGAITAVIHTIYDNKKEYPLPGDPINNESVFVKIDNEILDRSLYTVDYKKDVIQLKNNYPDGTFLSILTIGASGQNIYDYNKFIIRNRVFKYELPVVYPSDAKVLLSLNGRMLRENVDYSVAASKFGKLQIIFPSDLVIANDVVNYIIFAGTTNTFSQVSIDNTFVSNGVNTVHRFNGVQNPIPFNKKPLSHKVLVKVNDKILNAGYAKKFTIQPGTVYPIDARAVDVPTGITEANTLAFVNGQEIDRSQYNFNPSTRSIELVEPNTFEAGSELEITSIDSAEYYFVSTQFDVFDIYNDPLDLETVLSGLTSFELIALSSGTVYTVDKFKINGNTLTIDYYLNGLPEILAQNPFMGIVVPPLIYTVGIKNVNYVPSTTMTFDQPPAAGSKVEIYQFSNHDINNFERNYYDVLSKDVIIVNTQDKTSSNLISSGFITLKTPAYGSNYVWVIKNGTLLTANVDYILTLDRTAIQLKSTLNEADKLEIFSFNSVPSTKRYGFRIFKDMLDRVSYKRINQNKVFRLAKPLNFYDKTITLLSAEGLFVPNRINNVPGILFIGSERIEYFGISGNVISDIRRGTLGTGVSEQYAVGALVYDQNTYENINYADEYLTQTFVSDGTQTRFTLDFSLSEWMQSFGISENNLKDMFDIKVAGKRINKVATRVYDPEKALDSPEADINVSAEYTIDVENNQIVLTRVPPADVKIVIMRKLGKIWNDYGKPLSESLTDVSAFLLDTSQ